MNTDALRKNRMMQHLLESLERGESIGHYGRFVFAVVGRFFVDRDELIALLQKDPDASEKDARGMVAEVEAKDYSPPSREKILAWQEEQGPRIIPDAGDPDAGNVYDDLDFPDRVYEHIRDYRLQQAES